MASKVKVGLDAIAAEIENRREVLRRAKDVFTEQNARLGNIPTEYQAVITEINGYAPDNAFETAAQAELAALTVDFQTLKSAALEARDTLAAETEF